MFSTRRALCGRALSSSVRYDMRSKYLICIPSAHQIAIPNDMQVRTSAYADSTPFHPTTSSVLCPFTNECGVISSAPVPPYKNTSGVTLYTESGLVCKQHLTPIMLLPISMFSGPFSSGRMVAWGQWNADHWPKCIEPSLMKPITYCLVGHLSSCCQEQMSLQLRSILCSVSAGC
ncbi:hypothetical protein TNCV_2585471 [Trichonephila clavipes]|nr:hypothetical protein TNCV_2585471 [Trichonephila clavipes]